jgi:hypothetical protein
MGHYDVSAETIWRVDTSRLVILPAEKCLTVIHLLASLSSGYVGRYPLVSTHPYLVVVDNGRDTYLTMLHEHKKRSKVNTSASMA